MSGAFGFSGILRRLGLIEAVPGTPPSGQQALYIDPADHHLKRKDSAGSITDLESGGGGGGTPTFHGARVMRTANQTIGTGSLTDISWDFEQQDTDGFFDGGAPDRFTIPVGMDGWYLAGASMVWTSNSSGRRDLFIPVGSYDDMFAIDRRPPVSGASTLITVSGQPVPLVAGNYVHVGVQQTSGGNLDVFNSFPSAPVFWIIYLGA